MQKSRYDQSLRKLRQAREDLRQEYGRIRHDLLRLDRMIVQLETMNAGGQAARLPSAADVHDVSPQEIDGLSHAQAATVILSRASSPMTIRQLLGVLERAGRKLSAKNGYGILHKSLRNCRHFDSVAGKWRLVSPPPARRASTTALPRETFNERDTEGREERVS